MSLFTDSTAAVDPPNSRGWVSYFPHEKPSIEDEPSIKKARVESPQPPPPPSAAAAALPNRRGWVEYFAEVELPPPALFAGLASGVRAALAPIHPDATISEDAVDVVVQMMRLTCEALVKSLAVAGHTNVTTQEMESAVREVFAGELAKHGHSEGMKCVGNGGSTLVISLETISVCLDAVRIKAPCIELFAPMGFDADSCIYMAGALEYIAAEVLELSGNTLKNGYLHFMCDNHFRKTENQINIPHIKIVVVGGYADIEVDILGQRCGWHSLFVPKPLNVNLNQEEMRLLNLRSYAIGQPRVTRIVALLVGRIYDDDYSTGLLNETSGSLVSKTWYSIYENEAMEQLNSDLAKRILLSLVFEPGEYSTFSDLNPSEKFKLNVLLRMDGLVDALPEQLRDSIVSQYMEKHLRELEDIPETRHENATELDMQWFNELVKKMDLETITKKHWPEFFLEVDSSLFAQYNLKCIIGSIMTEFGELYPNLTSITLCGNHELFDWGDDLSEWSDNGFVPAINALATTNPSLTSIDMDTVPTNDNVVNAIGNAFPQLTSFSVTNGAHGETISDTVLDALRASHPGITITIRTWSEDE